MQKEGEINQLRQNLFHLELLTVLCVFSKFLVFVKLEPAQVILLFCPSAFFFGFSSAPKTPTLGGRACVIHTSSCWVRFFVEAGYVRGFLFQNHPT